MDLITCKNRVANTAGLLFTTNGKTPVSGFSKGRFHIAERMVEIAKEERGEPIEIPPWTFHDLRGTVSTGMTRIGIPAANVEAVLNHISVSRSGVAGIYNRHSCHDEKREALEAWAVEIENVVIGPEEPNIVHMVAARRPPNVSSPDPIIYGNAMGTLFKLRKQFNIPLADRREGGHG